MTAKAKQKVPAAKRTKTVRQAGRKKTKSAKPAAKSQGGKGGAATPQQGPSNNDKTAEQKSAAKKPKPTTPGKLSALDAAAKVLAEAKEPMTARQLIEAMSEQGLWTSPGGKTPAATLYSALIREISVKGNESRFVKAERGKFAANRP